jgi:hypothetical protein
MNNIKMDLSEIGWSCMDWINLAQDEAHKYSNEPLGSIKCWEDLV